MSFEDQSRTVLATERLRFRLLTLADLDNLIALNHDPGVMRYLDVRPPTREQTWAELGTSLREYEEFPGFGTWAAIEKSTGRFAGWFSLRRHHSLPEDHATLGYRLRRSVWGLGYATEGVRALVRLGFDELGLTRLSADTMAVNERSRRVMQKAGLRFVRGYHETFDEPVPGTEHGEVEYAITREEWAQGPA